MGIMIRWEYLIVSLPPFTAAHASQGHSASVDLLNGEGAAGWEAIGMSTLDDGTGAVLFKRPVSADLECSIGD